MTVSVLVVDDHPMVAQGIAALLETYDDIRIAGTLHSGAEAVTAARALRPDVILLDLNMPGMNGLAATELIREADPLARILILSMHDSPEYIAAALDHGAMGYVLKDVPPEEVRGAIDAVMAGGQYLCGGATAALRPGTPGGAIPLTGREQRVLLELAQGRSNKAVAGVLGISVRTVETHRKNIRRKLGIGSTAGLTRYALEHGVLQPDGRRGTATAALRL
ncbi:LuxR family two component transcriptional regulator [Hasllibacter halocynthiae]|uniref:LuxR family two component transcriptional regulator n=1 Tax=Hasllibacter halocynthiae TaxID=595589 RepID=A0A2T0X979_9RHOB|nr:response regulator transcription factor [Hasllibacter halocynthiae]PRY95496.1 LuxR family two component transcriptional regulator [Hasllibacter halocynthiae]